MAVPGKERRHWRIEIHCAGPDGQINPHIDSVKVRGEGGKEGGRGRRRRDEGGAMSVRVRFC